MMNDLKEVTVGRELSKYCLVQPFLMARTSLELEIPLCTRSTVKPSAHQW
jgi:hypothetical protein